MNEKQARKLKIADRVTWGDDPVPGIIIEADKDTILIKWPEYDDQLVYRDSDVEPLSIYTPRQVCTILLDNPKESGQAIILFLLAIVCIAFVLYLCYTAISMLSGSEGGLFEVLIGGLEEVIR